MISILLPTVRPQLFERAFASIAPACGDVPYEVVVVSDFMPSESVKAEWILSGRNGVIDAIYVAEMKARGDYLFVFNDESMLEERALERLYYHALENPDKVLSPHHLPQFNFTYYGKLFVPFPFVHRRTVKQLGGLFDPAYKSFYADPDFSMRAHAAGVPLEVVPTAVIHHHNGHDDAKVRNLATYVVQDRALFRSRWDHLGEFKDP